MNNPEKFEAIPLPSEPGDPVGSLRALRIDNGNTLLFVNVHEILPQDWSIGAEPLVINTQFSYAKFPVVQQLSQDSSLIKPLPVATPIAAIEDTKARDNPLLQVLQQWFDMVQHDAADC